MNSNARKARYEVPVSSTDDVSAKRAKRMDLPTFIWDNMAPIVSEWEAFARTLTPAADHMTPLALRNHIMQLLKFIIEDITSSQTRLEQVDKSQGKKEKSRIPSAAETHAALRLAGGFDIDQMVSEYRALRASVIKLWSEANTSLNRMDVNDITRFNEAIDQVLAESVSHYTQKVNYSKDLFLGVLSHDIRTPLNVISMSAQLLLNVGTLDARQTILAQQIYESDARITQIVNDLLDITRARFGAGLPVSRVAMDIGYVSRQIIDEMRAAYPARTIVLEVSGDLKGEWDKTRIGQMLSNLIGNAMQYSFKDSSVGVAVKGASDYVSIEVCNEGVPIPPERIGSIFNSLTRAVTDEGDHPTNVNLGLGLYITKDIVESHGGIIEVVSSEEEGTIFTIRLPRSESVGPLADERLVQAP